MSEEAPVNIGAVEWPDPGSAYFMVRRMQTKFADQVAPLGGRRSFPPVR